MKFRNTRLLIQYDGTSFCGWQIQSSLQSIQGSITAAIEKVADERVQLVGSGRTDAGVHARGQVANFQCRLDLPPGTWVRALNSLLPAEIRIRRAARVSESFHARFSAVAKTYRYQIFTGPVLPPWDSRYFWHCTQPINFGAMQRAADSLLGSHDMHAFTKSRTRAESFVRCVTISRFMFRGPRLTYVIKSNGFLHHMVRSILGTLLEVGSGRFSPADFVSILSSRDRRRAGRTAPPHGLFLEKVHYSIR